MDERQEFERWLKSTGRYTDWSRPLGADYDEQYIRPRVQEAWLAWQARASRPTPPAQEAEPLLRAATSAAPEGCYCPPDRCGAPVIMGVQQRCRRTTTPAADWAAAIEAAARVGIYVASKTAHAMMWRTYRLNGWPIISTWIDEAGVGESASLEDLWRRCIDEAKGARAVLLYREPGEVLKGAFVEAGAALANGVPVHAVGCGEFSFVNHRLVTQHATLDDALRALSAAPQRAGGG